MTQASTSAAEPTDIPKRPKGILKTPSHTSPPGQQPTSSAPPPSQPRSSTSVSSDPELTLQNTLQNAGLRRNSSNPRSSISRRQSTNTGVPMEHDSDEPRLKWDEANLYLAEQDRGGRMKIDEPKTPYTKRYAPEEDEEEIRMLDAQEIMVDELDKAKAEGSASGGSRPSRSTREAEIPGLDIGEPEENFEPFDEGGRVSRSGSVKGEKSVVVDPQADGEAVQKDHDGNVRHKEFEEMRKKHYEMKDIKGLLGHPENIDDLMEEDDTSEGPPPLPKAPRAIPNGS